MVRTEHCPRKLQGGSVPEAGFKSGKSGSQNSATCDYRLLHVSRGVHGDSRGFAVTRGVRGDSRGSRWLEGFAVTRGVHGDSRGSRWLEGFAVTRGVHGDSRGSRVTRGVRGDSRGSRWLALTYSKPRFRSPWFDWSNFLQFCVCWRKHVTFLYISSLSVLFFCFLLLLLSVSLLTPEEDDICRKRLCTIVSFCFVALVSTFP